MWVPSHFTAGEKLNNHSASLCSRLCMLLLYRGWGPHYYLGSRSSSRIPSWHLLIRAVTGISCCRLSSLGILWVVGHLLGSTLHLWTEGSKAWQREKSGCWAAKGGPQQVLRELWSWDGPLRLFKLGWGSQVFHPASIGHWLLAALGRCDLR